MERKAKGITKPTQQKKRVDLTVTLRSVMFKHNHLKKEGEGGTRACYLICRDLFFTLHVLLSGLDFLLFQGLPVGFSFWPRPWKSRDILSMICTWDMEHRDKILSTGTYGA